MNLFRGERVAPWCHLDNRFGVWRMNASEPALEHIRNSIQTAEALKMRSCAVLVSDLKRLLELAESVMRDKPDGSSYEAK